MFLLVKNGPTFLLESVSLLVQQLTSLFQTPNQILELVSSFLISSLSPLQNVSFILPLWQEIGWDFLCLFSTFPCCNYHYQK